MTLKPEARSTLERGPVDLDPDTDSDDSDSNSVSVAEPRFGHSLMNFPHEEPLEKGQSQPHGMMSFPHEESPEGKWGQNRPHRIINFSYEEDSKGMRGGDQSQAIMHFPEQRFLHFNYFLFSNFFAKKIVKLHISGMIT